MDAMDTMDNIPPPAIPPPPPPATTTDADGYTVQRKKGNKRSRLSDRDASSVLSMTSTNSKVSQFKLPTSNKYDILGMRVNSTSNTKTDNLKTKISPINVIMDEMNFPFKLLKELIKKSCDYPPVIYSLKNNVMSVRTSKLEDYRNLIKKLEENSFQYFLYKADQDPPLKIIIKNLPMSITKEEIHDELRDLGFDIEGVTQLRSRKDKSLLPIRLITVKRTIKAAEIYKVNTLAYVKIKVEDYVRRNEPRQCFKCQRFHHVAKLCHANARCVKCGEQHATTNCTKARDLPAKCANCGGNHTANYKGCADYKKIAARLKSNIAEPKTLTTALPRKGLQYADFPALKPRTRANAWAVPLDTSSQEPRPAKVAANTLKGNMPAGAGASININDDNNNGGDEDISSLVNILNDAIDLTTNIMQGKMSKTDAITKTAAVVQRLLNLALKNGRY